LEKPEASVESRRALEDYIRVIRRERVLSSSDLAEIVKKMKEEKGGRG
jgi:hypothetical protein